MVSATTSAVSHVALVRGGAVLCVPGFAGGMKGSSSLAVVKSLVEIMRDICPKSVVYYGTAITFSSRVAWDAIRLVYKGLSVVVKICGISAVCVQNNAAMLF